MRILKLILASIFCLFLSFNLTAQNATQVTGIVTDVDGQPLPGVTVVEKGTSNGTITNIDGNYELKVYSNDPILTFSFIGYENQDVAINNRNVIDVVGEYFTRKRNHCFTDFPVHGVIFNGKNLI